MLIGKRRNDYDVSFRRSVSQLTKEDLTTEDIIAESETMIERYYDDVGEYPSNTLLESIADAILSENLTDSSAHKVTNTGYAFFGDRQMASRKRREVPLNIIFVDNLYYHYRDPTIYTLFPFKKRVRSNIPSLNHRIDTDQSWAMKVKERDKFRCQSPNCMSRNGIMHAHHIYNYADYPELREEINNGVTLCEDCHTDFHRIYGNNNTNGAQLKEFFGVIGCINTKTLPL